MLRCSILLGLLSATAVHAAPPGVPSHLCWGAARGVSALLARVPTAVITGATRDRQEEARAWAENIARRRTWMRIMKAADGPELAGLQAWIDGHWKELRGHPEAIAAHLLEHFAGLSDLVMSELSPHFAGRAVDLRKGARLSRRLLEKLPQRKSVLDEGDHWHVDFWCVEPDEQ